jgi:sugar phosphate isomerase/epimerase
MASLLKESGLYSVGSHTGYDVFKDNFGEALAYNKAIGSQYVVCPGAPLTTREEIAEVARVLNEAAKKAAPLGLKVGYHNHDKEFEKIGGEYILDLLARATSGDVILEVDVYWAQYAGVDPIAYIEKWGGRVELVHLKQIGAEKKNVDAPDGLIDFKKVRETAKYAKFFVVEQEQFDKPVWDSIRNNVDYLKTL